MFQHLRTPRLEIRQFEESDLELLVERRNHPDVARYQTWTLPYTRDQAEAMFERCARDGFESDKQWMGTLVLSETGEIVGDVVVILSWEGRSAEIGYTLARAHWGHGYAVEAAEALVTGLFEDPRVTRVFGTLHPDNTASARVLERVGMLFEGHTRSSFWVGDENSDDWIYGMTRDDWDAWRYRSTDPPSEVRLDPITEDTAFRVLSLRTHKTQESFVASMAGSYADALFPGIEDGYPVVPWLRAVIADGEIVGFVMMAEVTGGNPDPYLWRMLIDRLHQRRGIGDRVIALLAEEFKATGAEWIYVSWVPGRWSPEPFYLRNGFEPTGEIDEDEIVARKPI